MPTRLFFVRIHHLEIDAYSSRIGRPPYQRIVVTEGEQEGETGGAAVRSFCDFYKLSPDAGFSFEEIKGLP